MALIGVMARSFESLVTQLSTHFITLGPEEIDEGINHALGELGRFAEVDRVYIFRFRETVSNTHEWCAEGITPQIERFQDIPYEYFPWWAARIRARELIHVERLDELPPEAAAEREVLEAQDVKSVVSVPLFTAEDVFGFVGFDSVRTHKRWSDSEIALLRVVGEMLVNVLRRKDAELERRRLEAQLADARRLEALGRLAGGVAHDFNNLLTVIGNLAELIERGAIDTTHQVHARQIRESAERATQLTRQLLRIGRRDLAPEEPIEVNRVIERLSPLLRRAVRESLELRVELERDLPQVRLAEAQLEQVLLNLALNSSDAMSDGGRLTIRTRRAELERDAAKHLCDVPPGPYVLIEVEDSGGGMTADVLSHAFEPFFTTKGEAGSGLGLATVYGVVRQAGGAVKIASRVGQGTQVLVYLPAIAPLQSERPKESERLPKIGGGRTVLVVEDFDPLRAVVAAMLSSAGYHVLVAESAERALDRAREHTGTLDLLLSDVVMPGRSGVELAREITLLRPEMRVLLMSGHMDRLAEPSYRVLSKPFDERGLIAAIQAVLGDEHNAKVS